MDIWIENYANNSKELSLATYKCQIRAHIKPALGDKKMSDLKTRDIQAMYNSLLRVEKPLTAKTIKNIHGVLHKGLSQAVKLGYIRINPADNVSLPRVEKPEIRPITDEHIVEFLEAIKGHCFELLYTVDLFTGMRKGETHGLTWDCVNLETGLIVINKQENLGHHAASFTMDVYGHVSDRMRLEGANRMEQFIQNISNSSIA